MKDLAQQGNKLIFTTSYGYMDQTLEAAKQFPAVKWEHCTGYKRADNVGTYNSRFYQGRAVTGTIAGMMSKTGVIGFVGSFKIPEVVMGVNAFTLAAQAINPKITTKLVMIDTWFDPAKEAAAAETLANLGCDVIAQHVDSPGGAAGLREAQDLWVRLWRGHVALRAQSASDGEPRPLGALLHRARQGDARRSWKSDDVWWGFKEGLLAMAPYSKAVPDNVRAAADKIIADTKAGTYEVFTGPISDQTGKERIAKGQRMEDKDLLVMDWYVKGVQS